MNNTQVTVPFIENGTVPIIQVTIGDYHTHAIIDSGSESTLVSKELCACCDVAVVDDDINANFTGVGEYKEDRTACLSVNATIGDRDFTIEGYEFNMSPFMSHFERIGYSFGDLSHRR